jgi:ABC-type antimicrobial peptide transport system permease subunit
VLPSVGPITGLQSSTYSRRGDRTMTVLLGALVAISLLVGSIGIMSIMLV